MSNLGLPEGKLLIKNNAPIYDHNLRYSKNKLYIHLENFISFSVIHRFRGLRRISNEIQSDNQGARKDGRGNEPVGSCAMCDARSTGPRALEGKNR